MKMNIEKYLCNKEIRNQHKFKQYFIEFKEDKNLTVIASTWDEEPSK